MFHKMSPLRSRQDNSEIDHKIINRTTSDGSTFNNTLYEGTETVRFFVPVQAQNNIFCPDINIEKNNFLTIDYGFKYTSDQEQEIGASEHNKNDEPLYKLLEKMVKMMDEYKMNVTVIGSYMKHRMDGQLVKMQDAAVTMPLNTVQLKETGLTEDKQKTWMKEVEQMKLESVMTAAARETDVPTMDTKIHATDINKLPQTPSWEWIVNYKKCCQQFKTDSTITEAMFNIKLETPEKTMVKMLVGNVTITIKDRSPSMTDTELAVIETEIPRTWFMFDDETDWARGMVQIFDEKMPGKNWQVILGAEKWQIDTTKWAWLVVEDSDVLVYSYKM